MTRDNIFDLLNATARQYPDTPITLDGWTVTMKDICSQAAKLIADDANRVLELWEATAYTNEVFLETRNSGVEVADVAMDQRSHNYSVMVHLIGNSACYRYDEHSYGKTWRCWKRRPTRQEIMTTAWEEDKAK